MCAGALCRASLAGTESLSRFVAAYQSVTSLKLGELWAIPIMLRLAVIENLRRGGVLVAAGWDERNLADSWAYQVAETAEKDPKSLILAVCLPAHIARMFYTGAGAVFCFLAVSRLTAHISYSWGFQKG